MANKVEAATSKSLIAIQDRIWYIKLMVNPLAHKVSPADYIILGQQLRTLIECKQVDVAKNPKAGYAFDRLTQDFELTKFKHKFVFNESFVLVGFVEKYIRKSSFFLVPIDDHEYFKSQWTKKSINRSEAETHWAKYKLRIIKGVLDFSDYF